MRQRIIRTKNQDIMSKTRRNQLSEIMRLAWQFIRKNGMSMSDALKVAWRNNKVRARMREGIVKFYFQKVDGSIREAYGTLKETLIPSHTDGGGRKKNDTVQTYFDTEKGEWRCFKKANLINIVSA